MGDELTKDVLAAVASIVGMLFTAWGGYAVWRAKHRRLVRERRAARVRREERERMRVLEHAMNSGEAIRKSTITEAYDTIERLRRERDDWRERALTAERALGDALSDAANVRALAWKERQMLELKAKHLQEEADRLRRIWWAYARRLRDRLLKHEADVAPLPSTSVDSMADDSD